MNKLVLLLPVIAVLSVPTVALACGAKAKKTVLADGPMCEGKAGPAVQLVSIDEVQRLGKAKKATTVDANTEKTRGEKGVIPGSVMLTSSSQFAATELPADKNGKLVFYCASTRCTASKKAAERALDLGYTDVAVLPEGIQGWVDAGMPTDRATPRS